MTLKHVTLYVRWSIDMTRNPFRSMINIGAVDTHIDPYTHTNEYSSEPLVAVSYSYCFTICHKHLRWDLLHSCGSTICPPVTSLPVLLSFLVSVFRHPSDQITMCLARRLWIPLHREGPSISLHRRRSKSQSWAILLLPILFREPESCRNSHPFTDDV